MHKLERDCFLVFSGVRRPEKHGCFRRRKMQTDGRGVSLLKASAGRLGKHSAVVSANFIKRDAVELTVSS